MSFINYKIGLNATQIKFYNTLTSGLWSIQFIIYLNPQKSAIFNKITPRMIKNTAR